MAIKEGDFIKLSYSGSVGENIFDTTDAAEAKAADIHSPNALYGPVTIWVGQKHVILGLDEEIAGKNVGDKVPLWSLLKRHSVNAIPSASSHFQKITSKKNLYVACR
ncbi:MAG TPA: hypothetical protein VMV55_00250 [Methanoregula sp.]|nr:hypothetical protein [Methanoregula sp.]